MTHRNLVIAVVVATLASVVCAAPSPATGSHEARGENMGSGDGGVQQKVEFPGIPSNR